MDRRRRDGLRHRDGVPDAFLMRAKERLVVDHRLGFLADLAHHDHRLDGIGALRRLPREHHAVAAVKHAGPNIRALGPSWPGIERHRLEHLRRTNDGLSRGVALRNQHFLCHKHLLDGDFNAEVASRHHDAVCLGEDFLEVVQAPHVLCVDT
eukprot:Opistho-1_new@7301